MGWCPLGEWLFAGLCFIACGRFGCAGSVPSGASLSLGLGRRAPRSRFPLRLQLGNRCILVFARARLCVLFLGALGVSGVSGFPSCRLNVLPVPVCQCSGPRSDLRIWHERGRHPSTACCSLAACSIHHLQSISQSIAHSIHLLQCIPHTFCSAFHAPLAVHLCVSSISRFLNSHGRSWL